MIIKLYTNDIFSPYYDTEKNELLCDEVKNCFVCPIIKEMYAGSCEEFAEYKARLLMKELN